MRYVHFSSRLLCDCCIQLCAQRKSFFFFTLSVIAISHASGGASIWRCSVLLR